MFQQTFAIRLASLRSAKGVTQEEVAKSLAVSGKTVSKWENGASAPDLEMLAALAGYYGVSTDFLLGLEESPSGGMEEQLPLVFEGLNHKEAALQAFALARSIMPAAFDAFCKDPEDGETVIPPLASEYHSQHRVASSVTYQYSIASEEMNLAVMLMRNRVDFAWMKDASCAQKMTALFAFLSDTDTLAVCHFLHSESCTQHFTVEFVAEHTGVAREKVERILEDAMKLDLCHNMIAHLAEGETAIYSTDGSGQILTMIALAYQKTCNCDSPRGYAYHYNSRLALMKGDAAK